MTRRAARVLVALVSGACLMGAVLMIVPGHTGKQLAVFLLLVVGVSCSVGAGDLFK